MMMMMGTGKRVLALLWGLNLLNRARLGSCDCPRGPPPGPSTIHNVSPSWHHGPHVFFTLFRPAARHGSTRRAGGTFGRAKRVALGWACARGNTNISYPAPGTATGFLKMCVTRTTLQSMLMSSGFYSQNGRCPDPKSSR